MYGAFSPQLAHANTQPHQTQWVNEPTSSGRETSAYSTKIMVSLTHKSQPTLV